MILDVCVCLLVVLTLCYTIPSLARTCCPDVLKILLRVPTDWNSKLFVAAYK
uniref:Uncharacterized protein n=1 Tax=Arundo donax TaxID=35708 RepID=A0A0A9GX24_ARUDO